MKTTVALTVACLFLATSVRADNVRHPVSCFEAYKECIEEVRCSMVWRYFNSTCNGQGCLRNSQTRSVCEAGLNTFMMPQYRFNNCRCDIFSEEFADCHYIQDAVLRSPCRRNRHTGSGVSSSSGKPVTCTSAMETCIRDSECALIWTSYNESCISDSQSSCSSNPDIDCDLLKHTLGETLLKDCFCPMMNDSESRCTAIWETLHQNPCMASQPQTAVTTNVGLRMAPTGGYNYGESTCQTAVQDCSANETCQEYFSRYISSCMEDINGQCRMDECMNAMRDVFTTVSPKLTHAMVFCYCRPDDSLCYGFKSSFTPYCVKGESPLPSCLTLKMKCESDPFCKARYQLMAENCAFRGNDCVRNYSTCRAALVGTFGTALSFGCECNGVERNQELCLEYKDMFTMNPCIVKSSKAYFKDFSEDIEPVAGCWVESKSSTSQDRILMPIGKWVKICRYESVNQEGCLCSEEGNLTDCFSLPTNGNESCQYQQDPRKEPNVNIMKIKGWRTRGTAFGRMKKESNVFTSSNKLRPLDNKAIICTCWNGDAVCIPPLEINTKKKAKTVPLLRVAYSVREVTWLNEQIRGIFTVDAVLENLKEVLLELNNETSCSLRMKKEERSLIEFSATVNCSHQLEVLMNMINKRDPRIEHDLVLSVLKIASVTDSVIEYPTIGLLTSQSNIVRAGVVLPLVLVMLLHRFIVIPF